MASKVTLSINETVIRNAKRYSRQHGTSLSRLVEQYLVALEDSTGEAGEVLSPRVRALRGAAAGLDLDPEHYRRHLVAKHLGSPK